MNMAFIVIGTIVFGFLSIFFTPLVMLIYSLAVGTQDDVCDFAIMSLFYIPAIPVAIIPNLK